MNVLLFVLISLYQGLVQSRTTIDPDWAMFNLWGFTGSRYGRGFLDCKSPAVHWWYWGLTKLVGKDVSRVKFAHAFAVGLLAIPIYFLGGMAPALTYAVLVNSGHLLAFHGNVGQVPAGLVLIALLIEHPAAAVLAVLATFYEPKYLPSLVVLVFLREWYWLVPVGLLGLGALYTMRSVQLVRDVWEANVTIPRRMTALRRKLLPQGTLMPYFTMQPLVYLLPWAGLAVMAKPDLLFWLPALAYFAILWVGIAIRPNHLFPLIPWVALALPLPYAWLLLAVDYLTAGLYRGDLWNRFYTGLRGVNDEARQIGTELRSKPGVLWVNGFHTGVYVWAQKPVPFGMTEQLEIREVAHERREAWRKRWKEAPPDIVVNQPGMTETKFSGAGYRLTYRTTLGSEVWEKLCKTEGISG